jgi:hypothetical protein
VFASTTPSFDELAGEEGELYSHLCTGSRAVADVAVPAAFGAGVPPPAGTSPIGAPADDGASDGSGWSGPAIALAVAVLALAAGYVCTRWWRQRPTAADAVGGLVDDPDP